MHVYHLLFHESTKNETAMKYYWLYPTKMTPNTLYTSVTYHKLSPIPHILEDSY